MLISMHSEGHIREIPDLNDCGMNVINPQYRANGLEHIKSVIRTKGRYCMAVISDMDDSFIF